MINNGLDASTTAENVFDDATYSSQSVYVRNASCPPGWPAGLPGDPCPAPGAQTEIEVTATGDVRTLYVADGSAATVDDGVVRFGVVAWGQADVLLQGGALVGGLLVSQDATATFSATVVDGVLSADDDAHVTMNGGTVNGDISVRGDAEVEVRAGLGRAEVDLHEGGRLVVDGGSVGQATNGTTTHDASSLTITGGSIRGLETRDVSTALIDGGSVTASFYGYGNSAVTMRSGAMHIIEARESSTFEMSGGSVTSISPDDDAMVILTGGIVSTSIWASDSSLVEIHGTDFEVDGQPVPFGVLVAQTGTLTGSLASGDSISNGFFHGGYVGTSSTAAGTIVLVDASPALAPGPGALVVAPLLACGFAAARRLCS